jgi:hypothetical protein
MCIAAFEGEEDHERRCRERERERWLIAKFWSKAAVMANWQLLAFEMEIWIGLD